MVDDTPLKMLKQFTKRTDNLNGKENDKIAVLIAIHWVLFRQGNNITGLPLCERLVLQISRVKVKQYYLFLGFKQQYFQFMPPNTSHYSHVTTSTRCKSIPAYYCNLGLYPGAEPCFHVWLFNAVFPMSPKKCIASKR